MNRARWKDPTVPLGVLIAKLAEETGEVANCYADSFFDEDPVSLTDSMMRELRDVVFIADCIAARLDAGGLGE